MSGDDSSGKRSVNNNSAKPKRNHSRVLGSAGRVVGFWIMAGAAWAQTPAIFPKQPATPKPTTTTLAPDTGRVSAEHRFLPAMISEPLMSMTIQVVQETPATCIYRSRHFEFKTPVKLGTTAMQEVCRAFESTHELVSKLPWGIVPWPHGGAYFHAELFKTRADYLATGAPKWSAANYSVNDRIFRIPFEEVGVALRSGNYALGGPINNDTITHEVTHQMMHEYLRFMPLWLVEGTAEYTAHLPYNSGRYNISGALDGFKQMRRNFTQSKRRGLFGERAMERKWVEAEELWGYTTSMTKRRVITELTPDPPEPPRPASSSGFIPVQPISFGVDPELLTLPDRYFSSHALVFFFMHFDGDGKGTRLKKYFDAIHEERQLWVDFEKSVEDYKVAVTKFAEAWAEFKKNPGVQDLGGGMIRYPSSLHPPDEPKPPVGPGNIDPTKMCAKHLGILLDGRTPATLDREVRAAFLKADSLL